MDVFTKKKRSEIMSKVRGKNNALERRVFSYLRKQGVYFQRHYSRVPGSPDVALPSKKIAIFIEGGFWHGWGFKKNKKILPVFWQEKIEKNIRRDRRTRRKLKNMGWRVLRVWDHQIKRNPERWLGAVETFLSR